MDTATPQGEFLFHVFGALAQFERSLTQERVRAGLAAARRRGRRGGRPAAIDGEKLAAVIAALDGGATKAAVCRTFGIPLCQGSCPSLDVRLYFQAGGMGR
jgi:DNA invertase Pin-like site-specific DNA recombinase